MANISKQFVYDVRRYLRISHTHFDAEITDLIGAAQADLILGGIKAAKDNADAEKYRNSYEMLKRHLQLSSEYIEEA